jgi:hypothetical protein
MKKNQFPHALAFRVDDATFEKLTLVAEAFGQTPGGFARHVVCTAIGSTLVSPKVKRVMANGSAIRKLIGELGRHGSLLNQIARSLNMNSDPKAGEALASMRHEYELTLKALRLALAGDGDL